MSHFTQTVPLYTTVPFVFVSQNGDAMDREAEEESLPGLRSQIRASTKIAAGEVIS